MTGKTHQIIGLVAGTGWYLSSSNATYGPATLGTVLVSSHLMALLPDLDRPAAKIWDSVPFGQTVGQVVDPLISHRNISHSLLGFLLVGIILSAIFSSFPSYWGIDKSVTIMASLCAYGSHLLADMFTAEGVPLFYPYKVSIGIPPKPFEGLRILTGKWFENYILFPLFNIIFLSMIWLEWGKIRQILFK